jgi:azurin
MAKVSAKKTSEPKAKKEATPKAKEAAPKAVKEVAPIVKKTTAPSKAVAKTISIDSACEQVVIVLNKAGVESQLQAELSWCIGSYHHDQNPIGLIENGKRALVALKALKAKNAKAVPSKVVTDLEKALNQA